MNAGDATELEEQIVFRGTRITSADAAAFMNEKARGPQNCEVCKSTTWLTAFCSAEGNHAFYPTMRFEGETRVYGEQGLHVFNFICRNCGHVRNHAMTVLADWVKNRGTDEPSE